MRKVILMTLLAVVSGGAAAEWVQVGSTEIGTIFANPATIRKTGNLVKMWRMADFKTADKIGGKQYLSEKTRYEYDCTEDRMRVLDTIFHAGNMGKGAVVHANSSQQQWQSVPPETFGEALWKFACTKR